MVSPLQSPTIAEFPVVLGQHAEAVASRQNSPVLVALSFGRLFPHSLQRDKLRSLVLMLETLGKSWKTGIPLIDLLFEYLHSLYLVVGLSKISVHTGPLYGSI